MSNQEQFKSDQVRLLEKLDDLRSENPEQITAMYQKLFTATTEGQMILVDLMDLFHEFAPTANDHEAGAQSVLIYIKNRILGVTEKPRPKGEQP